MNDNIHEYRDIKDKKSLTRSSQQLNAVPHQTIIANLIKIEVWNLH